MENDALHLSCEHIKAFIFIQYKNPYDYLFYHEFGDGKYCIFCVNICWPKFMQNLIKCLPYKCYISSEVLHMKSLKTFVNDVKLRSQCGALYNSELFNNKYLMLAHTMYNIFCLLVMSNTCPAHLPYQHCPNWSHRSTLPPSG